MALTANSVDLGWTSFGASMRIRLHIYTGTLPTTSTIIFTGECTLAAVFVHAQNGGKITIEEADQSSAFVRELDLDKKTPFQYRAENTRYTARLMASGVRVWAEKPDVHCQIRCHELLAEGR